jgi:hypothetical protein
MQIKQLWDLTFTGSLSLRYSSVAEQNNLVADCVAAQITR